MNTANKLTTFRFILAIAFVILFYMDNPIYKTIAFILFIMATITDFLDGYVARKYNQVTKLGKLMDPFSDVFLRITYFAFFLIEGLMPVWALVIILWRELGIIFVRMLLIREGEALGASKGGKAKALLYFISGIAGLFVLTVRVWWTQATWLALAEKISTGLFAGAAIAALLSFVDYWRHFVKSNTYRKFIDE